MCCEKQAQLSNVLRFVQSRFFLFSWITYGKFQKDDGKCSLSEWRSNINTENSLDVLMYVKLPYSIGISLGRDQVEEQGLGQVTVEKHGVRVHCWRGGRW